MHNENIISTQEQNLERTVITAVFTPKLSQNSMRDS